MSAYAADPQFSFRLPSLSYIDAKWEEPELRVETTKSLPPRKSTFTSWLRECIASFKAWHRDNVAALELGGMSDYELLDIGISRSDLGRLFDPAFNEELQHRGIKV